MPTLVEAAPLLTCLIFLALQAYNKSRAYLYSLLCISLNIAIIFLLNGIAAFLTMGLVLYYALHFSFQTNACKNERCFHLIFSLFWSLAFFVAKTPIVEIICLLGFFTNTFFVRLVQGLDKLNIKSNISFLIISAPLVFFIFIGNFTSDTFFTKDANARGIAMLLILTILISYFYLQTLVLDRKNKEGFYYSLIVLVSMALMLVKVFVTYNLTEIAIFEEPYRYRYLSWLVFVSALLLPLYYFFRGGLLDKFFSLSHLVVMSILLLFIQSGSNLQSKLSVILFSILLVFLLSLHLNESGQWKSQKASVLFLLAILIFLSPLNYALHHMLETLILQPDLLSLKAEILYFPRFFAFIPLVVSLVYAFLLGSIFLPSFELANFKKEALINKEILLALLIFVLGIYPFPLYIYIEFIINR